jgi:hypothetical protein
LNLSGLIVEGDIKDIYFKSCTKSLPRDEVMIT